MRVPLPHKRSRDVWLPGRDPKAVRHPAAPATAKDQTPHTAVVVGGGIAGLTAAVGLAERGVHVTLVEAQDTLGGRVRSWPVDVLGATAPTAQTMSRGFHAFFRQYYNLRALLRRTDPSLAHLAAVEDYPLSLAGGATDSFAGIPRIPPLNLLTFVARSPSFPLRRLADVDVDAALGLLDVDFPRTLEDYQGRSAADVLDELRFPSEARHLALEVFARSFFARPEDFSGGELVAMFHTYFLGSAEGLLFDVPDDDYDRVLWAPLGRYLSRLGADVRTGCRALWTDEAPGDRVAVTFDDGTALAADALVLATDQDPLQRLVAGSRWLGDEAWRTRVAALRSAPPFVVWRLWLDRPMAQGTAPFLGTSGYGPLDNVSAVHLFEAGAARWASANGGSVVEVHAYAVDDPPDEPTLRDQLLANLHRTHPELVGALVLHEEWLVRDDCPLISTEPWRARPEVQTPDPRVTLAGDGIRCDYPVALMERAATTGWLAANAHLERWGLPGHDVWTVPMTGRLAAVPHLRRAVQRLRRNTPAPSAR